MMIDTVSFTLFKNQILKVLWVDPFIFSTYFLDVVLWACVLVHLVSLVHILLLDEFILLSRYSFYVCWNDVSKANCSFFFALGRLNLYHLFVS